ncbi:CBS domain-containing protein [Candidatus Woesearchaeota archaeon]|nr:CBS domain-containing protein [Candidatus Woesearchaeota archaeon]
MEISSIVKNDFLELNDETKLSEVIGQMRQYEKRSALVFKNKRYLGLVEKKKIIHTNVDPSEVGIADFLQRTPILDESTNVLEAAHIMFEQDVNHLPVSKDKEVIGVVSSLDLANLALQLPRVACLRVDEVKILKSNHVTKDNPLSQAMHIMREDHVDHVPVFDQGELYGILSYRDIIRKAINWSPHRDKAGHFNAELHSKAASVETTPFPMLPVGEFSTNDNLISIAPTDSLKSAVDKMVKKRVKSLLIQDSEKLYGVLSVRNILGKVSSLEKIANYVLNYVGLNDCNLSEHQENVLYAITEREAEKLQRKIDETFRVTVHLKQINKEGKQSQFDIKLKIDLPGKILASEKSDWDLETALHKVFNIVESELQRV